MEERDFAGDRKQSGGGPLFPLREISRREDRRPGEIQRYAQAHRSQASAQPDIGTLELIRFLSVCGRPPWTDLFYISIFIPS